MRVCLKTCKKCFKETKIPHRQTYCDSCSSKICKNCMGVFKVRPYYTTKNFCKRSCRIEFEKKNFGRGGKEKRNCKTCMNFYMTYKSHIKHRGSNFCSRKCQGIYKSTQKGILSSGYKNGKSSENKCLRNSTSWKNWRKEVFERDSYICQGNNCKHTNKYFEPHHIKRFAKYPDDRFKVSNGVTLCKDCHNLTKKYDKLINGHEYEIRTQLYRIPESDISLPL